MSIASKTRTCAMCSGTGEMFGERCFACEGLGKIILVSATPADLIEGVPAQHQAMRRIEQMHKELHALERMVRQIDSLTAARTAREIAQRIRSTAYSLEATVVAAAREGRMKESGQL